MKGGSPLIVSAQQRQQPLLNEGERKRPSKNWGIGKATQFVMATSGTRRGWRARQQPSYSQKSSGAPKMSLCPNQPPWHPPKRLAQCPPPLPKLWPLQGLAHSFLWALQVDALSTSLWSINRERGPSDHTIWSHV